MYSHSSSQKDPPALREASAYVHLRKQKVHDSDCTARMATE